MNIKTYLDPSIPSEYFGYSKPMMWLITQKWFENDALSYELYISVFTVEEIERFENVDKKENIKDLILNYNIKILELSKKAIDLARDYMKMEQSQNLNLKMLIISQ